MNDITLKFIEHGNIPDCSACHLEYDYCSTQCEDKGHFEYVKEEPKKIQSEYEWKEKRSKQLSLYGGGPYLNEFRELVEWLRVNKPKTFETCNKDNTKVGDAVRCKMGETIYIVDYIAREKDLFVAFRPAQNKTDMSFHLSNFEIDTYKNRGEK